MMFSSLVAVSDLSLMLRRVTPSVWILQVFMTLFTQNRVSTLSVTPRYKTNKLVFTTARRYALSKDFNSFVRTYLQTA